MIANARIINVQTSQTVTHSHSSRKWPEKYAHLDISEIIIIQHLRDIVEIDSVNCFYKYCANIIITRGSLKLNYDRGMMTVICAASLRIIRFIGERDTEAPISAFRDKSPSETRELGRGRMDD